VPASNVSAQLTYQICPIILVGGIASQVPSGMLPMLNLFTSGGSQVNPSSLGSALILPFNIGDLDDAFGAFNVVPGGQLVLQQIGKYPFANQSVAANAVIREPLTLSVLMDTPMRGANPWRVKNQVFTALKSTLDAHNNAGGTYTVATPAFIYENLVMTSLTDISRAVNTVPQNAWRFDFEKPLVSLTELQGAMNFLTNQLTQGLATNGSNTGTQVGATQAQPAQMGQTFKIGGALTGGPP
jgi:hypothetical protein